MASFGGWINKKIKGAVNAIKSGIEKTFKINISRPKVDIEQSSELEEKIEPKNDILEWHKDIVDRYNRLDEIRDLQARRWAEKDIVKEARLAQVAYDISARAKNPNAISVGDVLLRNTEGILSELEQNKLYYRADYLEALKRYNAIKDAGLKSSAVYNLENEGGMPDWDNIDNMDDFRAELQKVRVFNTDPYSTMRGAELFTKTNDALIKYGDIFEADNRQWRHPETINDGNRPRGLTVLDNDRERSTWKTLRKLKETIPDLARQYFDGSDPRPLVSLIYDVLGDFDYDYVTRLENTYGEANTNDIALTRLRSLLKASHEETDYQERIKERYWKDTTIPFFINAGSERSKDDVVF